MTYDDQLRDEAALWGAVDEAHAATLAPDWNAHRHMLHNALVHTPDIDALIAAVQPGMQVLELGCASGWLTLACARQGAHVTGLDISERSLQIARDYGVQFPELAARLTYRTADLNALELPTATYDIIYTKGTLHHLIGLDRLIEQVAQALKPNGLFWISDQDGNESLLTSLTAGGLMFILPTHIPYAEKWRGLLRFGVNAPARIRASMEAEGLSPFEGAGRDHDWLKLVHTHFTVEREVRKPAVTGYLAHQVKLPYAAALRVLGAVRAVDGLLVRAKLLKSTGVVVWARKTF